MLQSGISHLKNYLILILNLTTQIVFTQSVLMKLISIENIPCQIILKEKIFSNLTLKLIQKSNQKKHSVEWV